MTHVNYFFPEELFPPVSQDYGTRISIGLSKASRFNILICGIVRDAENIVMRNLACVDHLRAFFNRSTVFVYENDSKDSTKILVDNFAKTHYNMVFKTENLKTSRLSDKSLERRVNMANTRNTYLERYNNKNYDLVIVLDLDLYGFSYTGLLNSLSYYQEGLCFGSNSIIYQDNQRIFFDSWAYKDSFERTEEEKNMFKFNRGELPIEVDSCFGGLMIYPGSILKTNVRYQDWDCDHVTLHKQLKDLGYKILLNPSQITLYSKHYYVN